MCVALQNRMMTVAPSGHENIFLLMPIAPGLEDTEEIREKYFQHDDYKIWKIKSKKIYLNILILKKAIASMILFRIIIHIKAMHMVLQIH